MATYVKDAAVNNGNLTQTEVHLYGSSRLGIWNSNRDVTSLSSANYLPTISNFIRGDKSYELTNHLGNVLVTVSDKKLQHSTDGTTVDYYNADVVTANDYCPGGMQMPGRIYTNGNQYRYGFNGKEQDKEVVQYDYGFRIYDPRLVRFKSIDPLAKSYPWNSPYSYAEGDLIRSIDLDGLEKYVVTNYHNKFGEKEETMIGIITDKETGEKPDMNLRYDRGKHKGESVAQGYDVLVREVRENAQGQISTSYSRKRENQLTPLENDILKSKKEVSDETVNPFQPGFGGRNSDAGESITGGNVDGFDEAKFEQSMFRRKFHVDIPPPPTQSQLNTAVNNLAAQIDLNTNKISPASRTAARNLGRLLLSATQSSATLNVTFLDPSGTNSFMNRAATNGSTFGNNANAQVRALANIVQQASGVNIQFKSVSVTSTQGNNGATLQLNQ